MGARNLRLRRGGLDGARRDRDALASQAGVPLEEFVANIPAANIPAATNLSTGRLTEPAEVAALVVFLASGKAPNISGSELVIDGGMLKQI